MPFEKDQFTSGGGWSTIRFGDSPESVRTQLRKADITWEEDFDNFHWRIGDGTAEIFFGAGASGEPERVVQFLVDRGTAKVNGHEIVGLKLDEALLELNVRSFGDTLWSSVDIDAEYDQGRLIDEAKRPQHAEAIDLLEGGTLWIKSLGIGLVLDCGDVDSVVLRATTDVPQVGCGPLDKETIGRVGDEKLGEKIATRQRAVAAAKPSWRAGIPIWLKTVLTLSAAAVIVVPIYWYVEEQIAWQKAEKLIGVVVETRPEGPFPDFIVVEYKQPDAPEGRVELKFSYTSARAVGDEVELFYLKRNPSKVMTRSQAVNEGANFSPILLCFTLPIGYLVLMILYPKLFRSGRRRS